MSNLPPREVLDAPIPKRAIATRQKKTLTLEYLEGWYVIDRMNQVFGLGGWSQELVSCKRVCEDMDKEGRTRIGYKAVVRLIAGGAQFEGVGFGEGIDHSPAQAHESAGKEAATDAFKRAAIHYGMAFGLELYDKRNVASLAVKTPSKSNGNPLPAARHALGLSPEDCHERVLSVNTRLPGLSSSQATQLVASAIVEAAGTGESLDDVEGRLVAKAKEEATLKRFSQEPVVAPEGGKQ